MLELYDLKNVDGAKKNRKRIGRGESSGTGGTSGRGHKGQKSRSGSKRRLHFEGGQLALFRRLPLRRGIRCSRNSKKNIEIVNVGVLDKIFSDGDIVDKISLMNKNIISKIKCHLKILNVGKLSKSLTVKADSFSSSSKEKIESANGKCELL